MPNYATTNHHVEIVTSSCAPRFHAVAATFVLVLAVGSQSAFGQEKLTPVSAWKNGFTPEQSQRFIRKYNAKSFVLGDDIGTYAALNLSEVFHVSQVARGGPVAKLESSPDTTLGTIKVNGPLGRLTLDEVIHHERSRMQGILVLHKGRIVFEKYPGMQKDASHVWMSSTKVISGLLIHLLEEEGKLSLTDKVSEHIPEYRGTDWDKITLKDVLHQQSGMDFVEDAKTIANPKSAVARAYAFAFSPKGSTKDKSIFEILKQVKSYKEPGVQFDYSSFNTHILGIVVERITKKKFADVVSERIWKPAGMEGDAELALTPAGEPVNGGVFASRLRDKARFGLLFVPSHKILTKKPIVGSSYFKKVYATKNSHAFPKGALGKQMLKDFKDKPDHASYQWDAVFSDGDLYKSGKNGQLLYVSPKNDVVVVWFSSVYYNSVWLPIYARAIVKHLAT